MRISDWSSDVCSSDLLALKSGDGLGGSPVRAMPEFAGYGWYNALPRVLGLSFQVETDNETFHYDDGASILDDLASGRVGTITLELAVRATADSEEPAQIGRAHV